MFTFLQPLFLIGLISLAVPLWLHFIRQKPTRKIAFSAYEFLRATIDRQSLLHKIRRLLLLITRMLLLAVLASAFAQPRIKVDETHDNVNHGALIVLDASLSMLYKQGNQTLFERARGALKTVIEKNQYRPMAVVVVGERVNVLSKEPSVDTRMLLKAADDLTLEDRVYFNAELMIDGVRQGLSLFKGQPTDVYIISDYSSDAFLGQDDFSYLINKLHIIDIREELPGKKIVNLALLNAVLNKDQNGAEQLSVQVKNYSNQDTEAELNLSLANKIVAKDLVQIPAQQTISHVFNFDGYAATIQSKETQLILGEVQLFSTEDGYEYDNHLPFVFESQKLPKLLLVNGEKSSVAYQDELFYIEHALNTAKPNLSYDVILPEDLATYDFSQYQLVVLANVEAPSAEVALRLREFVDKGLSVFISVGRHVQTDAYNTRLSALLPVPLREVFAASDLTHDPLLYKQEALLVTQVHFDSPFLHGLDRTFDSAFEQARVYQHFFVDNTALPEDHIALALSSSAPLLITQFSKENAGSLALLLTTLDRDWSDLAIQPVFQPLLVNLFLNMGRVVSHVDEHIYPVNTPLKNIFLGQTQSMLRTRAQENIHVKMLLPRSGERFVIDADLQPPLLEVGVYALYQQSDTKPMAGTAFSLAPALGESDFTPLDKVSWQQRWHIKNIQHDKFDTLKSSPNTKDGVFYDETHWFLLVLIVLVTIESALLFKRPRQEIGM